MVKLHNSIPNNKDKEKMSISLLFIFNISSEPIHHVDIAGEAFGVKASSPFASHSKHPNCPLSPFRPSGTLALALT